MESLRARLAAQRASTALAHPAEAAPAEAAPGAPGRAAAAAAAAPTLAFTIRHKIYPRPGDPSYRAPRAHVGAEGFLIADVEYVCERRLLRARVQGTLPHHAPYYFYRCRCERRVHPKYGASFAVLEILECVRLPLNAALLAWVLEHELRYTPAQVARAAATVTSHAALPPALADEVARGSLYAREQQVDALARWFPANAPTVHAALAALPPARAAEFRERLAREPWLFAFAPHCVAFGLPPGTAIPLAALAAAGAAPAPLADALACYARLLEWAARGGHTVFYEHNVRAEWRGPALAFLVERAQLVVCERVQTRACYWLAEHRAAEDAVLAGLARIWDARRAAGPPAPAHAGPLHVAGTEEQLAALAAVAAQPFVLVRGMPGTGKTSTIEQIAERYGPRQTLLCTLTGSMVAGHHERGLALSSTIHRPLTDLETFARHIAQLEEQLAHLRPRAGALAEREGGEGRLARELRAAEARLARFERKLARLQARLRAVRVLVVDEFSNVDVTLLGRLLDACPGTTALVLVFDEWQIPPIEGGQPCLDLVRALGPAFCVELRANMRVAGAACAQLLANDRHLLAGRVDALAFTELVAGAEGVAAAREGCFLVAPSGRGLAHDVAWIARTLLPDARSRQVLTLTNAARAQVNDVLQRVGGGAAAADAAPDGAAALFADQRLTVHTNFPAVALRADKDGALLAPDRHGAARPADAAPGGADSGSEEEEEAEAEAGSARGRARRLPWSDAVANGEVLLFAHAQDYDLRKRAWCTKHWAALGPEQTPKPGRARFLVARDGRRLCLHDGYVPRHAVLPAWDITVNKSQGREYAEVLFVLPAEPGPFGRRHLHVALSRGKRCVVLYGTRAQLRALAANPEPPRQTLLAWRLARALETWLRRASGIPDAFFPAARTTSPVEPVHWNA